MILYPTGTKVWYTKMSGGRVATQVQEHIEYPTGSGKMAMTVYLPGDPGPTICVGNQLSPRTDNETQ